MSERRKVLNSLLSPLVTNVFLSFIRINQLSVGTDRIRLQNNSNSPAFTPTSSLTNSLRFPCKVPSPSPHFSFPHTPRSVPHMFMNICSHYMPSLLGSNVSLYMASLKVSFYSTLGTMRAILYDPTNVFLISSPT